MLSDCFFVLYSQPTTTPRACYTAFNKIHACEKKCLPWAAPLLWPPHLSGLSNKCCRQSMSLEDCNVKKSVCPFLYLHTKQCYDVIFFSERQKTCGVSQGTTSSLSIQLSMCPQHIQLLYVHGIPAPPPRSTRHSAQGNTTGGTQNWQGVQKAGRAVQKATRGNNPLGRAKNRLIVGVKPPPNGG